MLSYLNELDELAPEPTRTRIPVAAAKSPQSKPSAAPRTRIAKRWVPLLIALGAFVLRVIHLLSARHSPLFENLGLDAKFYDRWATVIAEGDWVGVGPFFMGPLYPYFLAVFYRLFDVSILQTTLIQAAVDSATCALIYLIALRIWAREREAVLAGVLACLYGPMMLYTGELLFPTLAMFINCLFLLLVLRSEETQDKRFLFMAGILLGVAALGKGTSLVFYPAVVLWWLLRKPRPVLRSLVKPAAILALGVAAVVLPVTARNRIVGGDWVLITSNAGLNFYIGNHAKTSGAYLRPTGLDVNVDPEGRRIAEAEWERPLQPSGVSKYWFSKAFEYLEGRPERFLSLYVKKMVFFWGAMEIPQIENFNFQKQYSPILRLPFPSYGWIVPLAVVGVVLAGTRRRWAALPMSLAIIYSLAIAVFFVTGRYRMAVVPYLLVLSPGGILVIIEGTREWRKAALGLGLCLALALVAHSNPYNVDPESGFAEFEYRLGLGHELNGDLETAEMHYRKALGYEAFHPNARLNLGVIFSRTGRLAEGRQLLETLSQRYPDHTKAHYNLGLALLEEEEYSGAIEAFRRAVTTDPTYVRAWNSYGGELYRQGAMDEAREALGRAVSLGKAGTDDVWMRQSRFLLIKLEQRAEIRTGQGSVAKRLRQADLLAMAEEWDAAIDLYEKVGREDSIAEGYYEVATVAYNLGRWSECIEALTRCVDLDAGFPGAHHLMGSVHVNAKDYDSAIRALEAERRVNPGMVDTYFKLGLLYENHAQDLDAAIEAYQKYLDLNGPRSDIVRSRLANLRKDK
jgi:tetratricopeptide (TPR) repeat protein